MARLTDQPKPPAPPPPRSPFLPPAPRPPRPPLPPAAPALQQRAWAALTLAVLSLIAMVEIGSIRRGIYVIAVALAVALIGLALAINALSAARRAGTRRPRGGVAAVVLCGLGSVISGFALIGFIAYWSPLMTYANCLNGASTISVQDACQQQLDNTIGGHFTLFGSP
jgi:hypothetical protein